MPAPKRKTPVRRKRTSDPNLEPGLAAATRRSQAPKKKASPRAELKSLQKQMIEKMMEAMRPFSATPKKKASKAVRKYALSSAPAKTGKRLAPSKSERVSPPKKKAPSPPPPRRRSVKPVPMPEARIPPPRPGRPRSKPVPMPEAKVPPSRPGRRKIKPVPMPSGPGQQRPSPSKPTKKRAPARPRAAAPKRAKPAASPYDTLGNQRRRRPSTASRKRLK